MVERELVSFERWRIPHYDYEEARQTLSVFNHAKHAQFRRGEYKSRNLKEQGVVRGAAIGVVAVFAGSLLAPRPFSKTVQRLKPAVLIPQFNGDESEINLAQQDFAEKFVNPKEYLGLLPGTNRKFEALKAVGLLEDISSKTGWIHIRSGTKVAGHSLISQNEDAQFQTRSEVGGGTGMHIEASDTYVTETGHVAISGTGGSGTNFGELKVAIEAVDIDAGMVVVGGIEHQPVQSYN